MSRTGVDLSSGAGVTDSSLARKHQAQANALEACI